MSDTDDIFGKIDALLGKRVGFAGAVRQREENDFPLLTEVVEAPVIASPEFEPSTSEPSTPEQAPLAWQEPAPAPLTEAMPEKSAEPWPLPPGPDVARLVWGDEPLPVDGSEAPAVAEAASAEETPRPRDTEFEAMLRRIIREELERLLGRG